MKDQTTKQKTTYTATRTWPDHSWMTDMPFEQSAIDAGEIRGEFETVGPWQLIKSYRALAVEYTNPETDHYNSYPYYQTAIIHGMRSLLNPRESGHDLEGKVSIEGKKYRAFTSTAMFNVNGKLVDVAILYVCKDNA